MDQSNDELFDKVVEDEVRACFRDVTLPPEYYAILKQERELDPTIPSFKRARVYKYNAKKRRLIQGLVARRYHADLQDDGILSMAQLREINVKRGEWSPNDDRLLESLSDLVNRLGRELYLDGMDPQLAWTGELSKYCKQYRELIIGELTDGKPRVDPAQRDAVLGWFDRWIEFEPSRQVEYDTLYAAEQGRTTYSQDTDLQWLIDHVPGVDATDVLSEIQDLRDKLTRYIELLEKRTELTELRWKHAKIFSESVESRRDTTEEMARLFYCCNYFDETKQQFLPLSKDFDELWALPDEIIQWLLVEVYFFLNGIPDEARPYLEAMGFIVAPRRSGSTVAPDASPAEPTSKTDSLLVETMP